MNTTLSPVTVQRFFALQGELIGLVELDYTGLNPKLEQIIRAFEFTQIELSVYLERGYGQGRGAGQPEADRCALACAFLAKAVLDLKTSRALIDRLQADSNPPGDRSGGARAFDRPQPAQRGKTRICTARSPALQNSLGSRALQCPAQG